MLPCIYVYLLQVTPIRVAGGPFMSFPDPVAPTVAVQAGRGQVPAPLRVFRGGLPRCIPHRRRLGRSGAWGESWYGSHVTALNLPSYCCR